MDCNKLLENVKKSYKFDRNLWTNINIGNFFDKKLLRIPLAPSENRWIESYNHKNILMYLLLPWECIKLETIAKAHWDFDFIRKMWWFKPCTSLDLVINGRDPRNFNKFIEIWNEFDLEENMEIICEYSTTTFKIFMNHLINKWINKKLRLVVLNDKVWLETGQLGFIDSLMYKTFNKCYIRLLWKYIRKIKLNAPVEIKVVNNEFYFMDIVEKDFIYLLKSLRKVNNVKVIFVVIDLLFGDKDDYFSWDKTEWFIKLQNIVKDFGMEDKVSFDVGNYKYRRY